MFRKKRFIKSYKYALKSFMIFLPVTDTYKHFVFEILLQQPCALSVGKCSVAISNSENNLMTFSTISHSY